MKALITGGSGFIGSFLSESLLQSGNSVICLDNLSTGFYDNIEDLIDNENFSFVKGDVMDENLIDELVSQCDVVFHLAAAVGVDLILKNPIKILETNIKGTDAVLKSVTKYDKPVLIASTSEIYGKSTDYPFKEDSDRLLGPTTISRWAYSDSKAIDEFLSLGYFNQFHTKVVIARLFNTVGPRQTGRYGMVLPRFVESALSDDEIKVYGDGTQRRCFMHVHDAIKGLISLIDNPAAYGQIYNIGQQKEISIYELAEKIIQLANSNSKIQLVPYSEAYDPGFEDMPRRIPDTTKINSLIGWKANIELENIINDVIEFQSSDKKH